MGFQWCTDSIDFQGEVVEWKVMKRKVERFEGESGKVFGYANFYID